MTYRLDGALFFGPPSASSPSWPRIADVEVVILRLPGLQVLDATGAQALGEIVDDLRAPRITVPVERAPRDPSTSGCSRRSARRPPGPRAPPFTDLDAAIAHAREHVTGAGAGDPVSCRRGHRALIGAPRSPRSARKRTSRVSTMLTTCSRPWSVLVASMPRPALRGDVAHGPDRRRPRLEVHPEHRPLGVVRRQPQGAGGHVRACTLSTRTLIWMGSRA